MNTLLLQSVRRAAVVSTLLIAAPALATPPLAELAPEKTVIIAGLRNMDSLRGKLEETGLLDLLQEDSIREFYDEAMRNFDEQLEQAAADVGFDKDDVAWPTGEVGIAVFAATAQNGQPAPGVLAMADFGPNADGMEGLLRKLLENDAEQGQVQWEEIEMRGRTVLVIETEPDAPDDQFGGGMGGGMGIDPEAVIADAFRRTWIVREDSTLIACTNRDALEAALGVCDGDDGGAFTDRDDYAGLTALTEEGHDSYALFLTRDLGQLIAAADTMGMAMMIGPMVTQFVGRIAGIGVGYDLATEHALVEGVGAVYMPDGRAGLTALFETETEIETPPGFASGNAVGYSRVNFDFEKLPAFVAQVMQMAAMFGAPQPGPGEGPGVDEVVGQFTACLGRSVQIVQTLDRPITASSFRQVMAIECTKPEALENLVGTFGAGMGLEGRDFMGHRIYAMDPAMASMMMPMPMAAGPTDPYAVGIGSGRVFLGTEPSVEQALRSAGGESELARDDGVRRAIAALDADRALAWGWGDWISSMEAQIVVAQEQMDAMMAELGADDPELAAEFADMEGLGGNPMAMLGDIDWDALKRHFGPTSWIVNVHEAGFVGRSYVLRP